MDYKKSLNLPATKFPMKASLANKEPEQLKKWEKSRLYETIRDTSKGRKPFILHDGPPYANGRIHLGHAMNKILKDIIVRSKQMDGYYAPYVPGWDCHGLPIEHKVDKELGKKKKEMTKSEIRKHCRKYAEKYVEIQKEEFKRLGILGEWDDPYLTMDYIYEARIVKECLQFALNDNLYKSKKPIHWCCSCKTALAEAEIEYADEKSPSVYVKFPLVDDISSSFDVLKGKKISVAIWTTTPWTLPANLAIALHPDFVYAAVLVNDGEVLIVAKDLVERVMIEFGITEYSVLTDIAAKDLEKKECSHPIFERKSLIILGNHVTLEAGTGCVHTAPGHGREDYDVGLSYGLEVYSPVNDSGCFTDDVKAFSGQFVFKANSEITQKLKSVDALLKEEEIAHSYPHCWRCKRPVIFRATPQWFISMDKTGLREKSLKAIDQVKWIPHWGRERIYGMIENRPDWCISRQRTWGVPIALFYCEKCEEVHINETLVERIYELFKKHGADIWFDEDVKTLMGESATCKFCGHQVFKKETDILDVWFDSGVSHAAVLEEREALLWPSDLYLEGSDQHRGWFHSSLLTAIGNKGSAPYKEVLTHGFIVDGKGKKMSKSLGNVVAPDSVIKKYGAEILRLWVSATDYRDDVRISDNILRQLSDAYRRIRNTCRFILGNLSDYDPLKDKVPYDDLMELDRYALSAFQKLTQKVLRAYENYEFHVVYHSIYNHCTVNLSAFYLDILKDRLYASPKASPERKSAQTALYHILDHMVRLMAPILVITSEEIWGHMPDYDDKPESIHLARLPEVNEAYIDLSLEEKWSEMIQIRSEVTRVLESAREEKIIGHSLDASVTLSAKGALFTFLQPYESILRSVFIVSEVTLSETTCEGATDSELIEGLSILVTKSNAKKCERCWIYDRTVGDFEDHPLVCSRCHAAIQTMGDIDK